VLVTLGPLRPMKGLMIALQYHHQAAESRFGQVYDQKQMYDQKQVNEQNYDKEHQEP
jgi:hypothetical protein